MMHPEGKEAAIMFSMTIRPEVLASVREMYPAGTRVRLIEMNDQYRDMPAGLEGTVMFVDDLADVHVQWDNGSTLAVVYGIDKITKI